LQQALAARAHQPLPNGLTRLVLAAKACGWVDPRAAACLAPQPLEQEPRRSDLHLAPPNAGFEACSRALMQAALRLRDAGLLRQWRDEQLDVRDDGGSVLATVERAASRMLGIATRSVHLNAFAADGSLVAALRADHKPSDPGLWDNLAGGMVAAGESDQHALEREALEEAGLDLAGLRPRPGRPLRVLRAIPDGLMVETVVVFDVDLPAGFVPLNRDGEVAGFGSWTFGQLLDAIERGAFTLEAALATLDALARRAPAA